MKILIVEDETLIAFQLKQSLIRAGHTVCGISSRGEQAVESARLEKPDVILMDIHLLGVMDGVEAARQISTFLSVILIFTTGYQDAEQKQRAMVLKPKAYLIKPVAVQTIIQAVG